MKRGGGKILVDQLELHGVGLAFCVPGESYLPILDALHDSPIRLISCRHEAAAANMAEAYGKLTGRPGVCFVTRGPGSTQAAVGIHTADQDSTPLVVVGEGGWTAQAGADVIAFCTTNGIPVAASFRCQDYVDNGAEVYAGHL